MKAFGPRARLLAKILVSVGCLAALFHWIDAADLRSRLRGLSWPPLIAAMALNMLLLILNAAKLHMIFPPPRPAFSGIVRINLTKVFFSAFIPGGAGSELARWAYLSRASGSRHRAMSAVLMDRVTGLWAQVLLALIAWIALSRGTVGLWLAVPASAVILAAGLWAGIWGYRFFVKGIVLLAAWFERRMAGAAGFAKEALEGGGGPAATGKAGEVVEVVDVERTRLDEALTDLIAERERFMRVASLSLVNHVLAACAFLLIDRSIGGDLGPAHALIFIFWYTVILVIPVTMGNWGLSEGTLGVLYHYAGAQSATGVLISLLLRVMNLPAILLGLVYFLKGVGRPKSR